ncbi:MAG TPA: hypothetical protein VG013_19750 [Gemmataceae bacterium]|jgi:hypothetical protein|nr:hypothetical protein [Gemmataceae bacterium]
MRSLACWRLARLSAGVLSALLLGTLFAPPLQAGCGDYLLGRSGTSGGAMKATGQDTADGMSMARHEQLPGHDSRHVPCSGPNCSRGSLPTAPAPTAPLPGGSEDHVCLNASSFAAGSGAATTVADQRTGCPVRGRQGVYHPPRLSPSRLPV